MEFQATRILYQGNEQVLLEWFQYKIIRFLVWGRPTKKPYIIKIKIFSKNDLLQLSRTHIPFGRLSGPSSKFRNTHLESETQDRSTKWWQSRCCYCAASNGL
jgi:hypothetical protein